MFRLLSYSSNKNTHSKQYKNSFRSALRAGVIALPNYYIGTGADIGHWGVEQIILIYWFYCNHIIISFKKNFC